MARTTKVMITIPATYEQDQDLWLLVDSWRHIIDPEARRSIRRSFRRSEYIQRQYLTMLAQYGTPQA